MGLDQYLNVVITTDKSTSNYHEMRKIATKLNQIISKYGLNNPYDPYEEDDSHSTIELTPIANIDGFNTNVYKLFDVALSEAYYRKANQIQNYFEERFYDNGNDYDGDEYNNIVTKIDDYTLDDLLDRLYAIEQSDHPKQTADERFPTTDGFFYGGIEYDKFYFNANNKFKADLVRLQTVRNQINKELEQAGLTDYHAVLTYRSWW